MFAEASLTGPTSAPPAARSTSAQSIGVALALTVAFVVYGGSRSTFGQPYDSGSAVAMSSPFAETLPPASSQANGSPEADHGADHGEGSPARALLAGSSLPDNDPLVVLGARVESYPQFPKPMERFMRPNGATLIRNRTVQRHYRHELYRQLAHNFSVMSIAEFASNETRLPDRPAAHCELALIESGYCYVLPVNDGSNEVMNASTIIGANETAVICAQRVSRETLNRTLPPKCLNTSWFRAVAAAQSNRTIAGEARPQSSTPHRGHLFEIQMVQSAEALRTGGWKYVPAAERPAHKFGPPVRCSSSSNGSNSSRRVITIYPISYAIPADNFVRTARGGVTRAKLWDFAPMLPVRWPGQPGLWYPLQTDDEWLGMLLHERSFYAFTHKRGGWDCLRHYEILAGGAVPYFIDLPLAPPDSITSLPRKLIWELMTLLDVRRIGLVVSSTKDLKTKYAVMIHPTKKSRRSKPLTFIRPADILHEIFNATRYFELADQLHRYAKAYLTTASLATYMLVSAGAVIEPKHILVFHPAQGYDYLAGAVVNGFFALGIPTTVAGRNADLHFAPPSSVYNASSSRGDAEAYMAGARVGAAGGAWVYGFRIRRPPVQTQWYDYEDASDTEKLRAVLVNNTVDNVTGAVVPPVDLIVYVRASFEPPTRWPLWAAVAQQFQRAQILIVDAWDQRPAEKDAAVLPWAEVGVLFKREITPFTCTRA
jgi:hypothetical protein